MPALSRAVATTGPEIPPPMTSAVRTLDVVAVDMGSLLHVVFVGRSAPRSRTGTQLSFGCHLVAGFVSCGHRFESVGRGWLRAASPGPGGGAGAPPRGHYESSSRLLGPSPRVRP